MSTSNSVWVIIGTQKIRDSLRNFIDSGHIAEARKLDSDIKALEEKMRSLLAEKGGTLVISSSDRIVMEMPLSVAEELPVILEGYKQLFGSEMAVGVGLDFSEAGKAMEKSAYTGEIELYNPVDDFYKNEEFFNLPPNLFDPETPPPKDSEKERIVYRPKRDSVGHNYVAPPSVEEQLQSEAFLIQGIMQQMGGALPQQDAQLQTDQQQIDQQQAEPRDLLEALNGGQIPNREPENQQQEEKESNQPEAIEQQEVPEEENSDQNTQIAEMLGTIKEHIPQLMRLAQNNPKAFDHVMKLINKFLDLAKQRKKSNVEKSQADEIVEELNKRLRLPVGTRRGRKVKVLIDGKEVWRSMASGIIKDIKGRPVSVKSVNAGIDVKEEENK